jgi:hypothetical protein
MPNNKKSVQVMGRYSNPNIVTCVARVPFCGSVGPTVTSWLLESRRDDWHDRDQHRLGSLGESVASRVIPIETMVGIASWCGGTVGACHGQPAEVPTLLMR